MVSRQRIALEGVEKASVHSEQRYAPGLGRCGVSVTAVWLRESTFGLSLSKAEEGHEPEVNVANMKQLLENLSKGNPSKSTNFLLRPPRSLR